MNAFLIEVVENGFIVNEGFSLYGNAMHEIGKRRVFESKKALNEYINEAVLLNE